MCTVTFIARRNGYLLGMNRDEKLDRAIALPPRQFCLENRKVICPSEPGGGTWIGVNDAGSTLALINWYSVPGRASGNAVSRGEVVRLALPSDSVCSVERALARLPLEGVNPFRLLGVFPADRHLIEWRWNSTRLDRLEHRWQTGTWISSGFDEPGAQLARERTFRESLREPSATSVEWLRRLHGSHTPVRGPYSTCMHRGDAATVSYTEILVSPGTARVRYRAGAPCCGATISEKTLAVAPTSRNRNDGHLLGGGSFWSEA